MLNFKLLTAKYEDKFWKFLQLQLFITIASWPILIYWGLPISIASPIGNLIFAPFLTIFLLLSSLIFITEIINFPNLLLIDTLEIFDNVFKWFISFGNHSWLISFYKPSLIISVLIPVFALIIAHNKVLINPKSKTFALVILLMFTSIFLKYQAKSGEFIKTINFFNKEITIIKSKEKNIIIDSGALGCKVSANNWVNYKFIPILWQNGIDNIDSLIILKPSSTILKSVNLICEKIKIKNIYIISWSGELNNVGWFAWQTLLEFVKKNKINFFIIDKDNYRINLFNNNFIEIKPQEKIIKKNKLKYKNTQVNINFLNQNITISTN